MIMDKLENAANHYYHYHPLFQQAFAYLHATDLKSAPDGKVEIKGNELFASFTNKQGKKTTDAKLEAHRKYIDIQFLIEGEEQIGWKPLLECKEVDTPFSEEKDIMFYKDAPQTFVKLTPGTFCIFFPHDAHAPMVSDGMVKKVVLKIQI